MTLTTTIRQAVLSTNGSTTVFPFSFKLLDQDHLKVELLNEQTEAVEKTYGAAEYVLGGLGTDAGSVTITPAPAADKLIRITRTVPYTQDTEILNQGGFYPDVIEDQLDRIVMQVQQLSGIVDALTVSFAETVSWLTASVGGLYISTTKGLAGTSSGEEFAVDNFDGTATIYLNNLGVAIEQRTVILDPSNSGSAALIGAIGGTVQEKLTEALGNGSTVFTVATLPTASSVSGAFRYAFVSDSNVAAASNFGAIVAGGGSNVVPVYSDGTNWRIG